MMKNHKVVASIILCFSAFSSSTVFAAHYKDEMILPAYNWTGFYAGANVGVVNNSMDITDTNGVSFLSTLHQVTNPSITGGLQAGYRRQSEMNNLSAVYGLEISANISNAGFDKQYGSPFAAYQLNFQHQLRGVGLLEAMGGIAADRTLLFLAAGLSLARVEGTTTNQDAVAFFNSFNVNKTVFGTVLGAGVEYACTDKLSLRFKADVVMPNSYSVTDNVGNSYLISNNIVQAVLGLNYKFA